MAELGNSTNVHTEGHSTVSEWISLDAVLTVSGLSKVSIHRKVRLGEIISRQTEKRSRNGRLRREFAISSLPPDWQRRLQRNSKRDMPACFTRWEILDKDGDLIAIIAARREDVIIRKLD